MKNDEHREMLSQLRQQGKLTMTIKSAQEVYRARQQQRFDYGSTFGITALRKRRVQSLYLGQCCRSDCYIGGLVASIEDSPKYRRLKNWISPSSLTYVTDPVFESYNRGSYSSSCRYTLYEYSAGITAYAYLNARDTLKCKIGRKTKVLRAPCGWSWRHDESGWCIFNLNVKPDSRLTEHQNQIEYHFTAEDVLTKNVRYFVREARKNFKTRKNLILQKRRAEVDQEKQRRAQDRLVSRAMKLADNDVFVCAADSHAAGNCKHGTTVFQRRNKINQNHLRADVLLNFGRDEVEKERIQGAIFQAKLRHATELAANVCDLEYHYSN